MELSRTELERQVHDVINRCREPIEQAVRDAGITVKRCRPHRLCQQPDPHAINELNIIKK